MSASSTVASLVDLSMSSDCEEFDFDATRFSDITVHYRSASFHMHQLVLAGGSKYLSAVLPIKLEQGATCSLSERCSESTSRSCIELPGEKIGGEDISVSELHEFFRCLYADQLKSWRKKVRSDRQNDKWPVHGYFSKVVLTRAEADEIIIDVYELDGVRRHVAKGQTMHHPDLQGRASSFPVERWIQPTPSLDEHKNYHLADYFQCSSMMTVYGKQALVIAKAASDMRCWLVLWRILLLSDRYGWSKARKFRKVACLKDKRPSKMEFWKDILAKMKPSTQAELPAAALVKANA